MKILLGLCSILLVAFTLECASESMYYGRVVAENMNPQNAQTYLKRGNAYFNLNNFQRAIEDYDRAIELDGRLSNAYFCRGYAYILNKKDPDRRIGNKKSFDKTVEFFFGLEGTKDGFTISSNEAKAMIAIENLNRAIELDPNINIAYILRFNAYKILKIKKDAKLAPKALEEAELDIRRYVPQNLYINFAEVCPVGS